MPEAPARRYWHQGFGVIGLPDEPRVPFVTEEACRRAAQRSTAAGFPVTVFPDPSTQGWSFAPASEEES